MLKRRSGAEHEDAEELLSRTKQSAKELFPRTTLLQGAVVPVINVTMIEVPS